MENNELQFHGEVTMTAQDFVDLIHLMDELKEKARELDIFRSAYETEVKHSAALEKQLKAALDELDAVQNKSEDNF